MVYLLLALLGVACIYGASRREPATTLLPTYLVAWSMICVADWVCFGWFSLYSYHSGVSGKPLVDAAFGEFAAEFLFVPSLTILLLTYASAGVSIVAGTVVVTVLEFILARQGAFIHYGWRLWHTAVAFPAYFAIAAWYWTKLHGRGPLAEPWRKLTRLCCLVSVLGPFNLALRTVHAVRVNLHLAATDSSNQSVGRFLVFAILELPLGYWVLAGATPAVRWARTGVATLALAAVNYGLAAMRWQVFTPPWSGVLHALTAGLLIRIADSLYQATAEPNVAYPD